MANTAPFVFVLCILSAPFARGDCEFFEFTCDNGQCITQSIVCNGVNNCGDFSDERDCECISLEYTCRNRECVSDSDVCDGTSDCSDGSDEDGCTEMTSNTINIVPVLMVVIIGGLLFFFVSICICMYRRHRARSRAVPVTHRVVPSYAPQRALPLNSNVVSRIRYPPTAYGNNAPLSTAMFGYPNLTRDPYSFNAPPSYDETTAVPPIPSQPSAPPIQQRSEYTATHPAPGASAPFAEPLPVPIAPPVQEQAPPPYNYPPLPTVSHAPNYVITPLQAPLPSTLQTDEPPPYTTSHTFDTVGVASTVM